MTFRVEGIRFKERERGPRFVRSGGQQATTTTPAGTTTRFICISSVIFLTNQTVLDRFKQGGMELVEITNEEGAVLWKQKMPQATKNIKFGKYGIAFRGTVGFDGLLKLIEQNTWKASIINVEMSATEGAEETLEEGVTGEATSTESSTALATTTEEVTTTEPNTALATTTEEEIATEPSKALATRAAESAAKGPDAEEEQPPQRPRPGVPMRVPLEDVSGPGGTEGAYQIQRDRSGQTYADFIISGPQGPEGRRVYGPPPMIEQAIRQEDAGAALSALGLQDQQLQKQKAELEQTAEALEDEKEKAAAAARAANSEAARSAILERLRQLDANLKETLSEIRRQNSLRKSVRGQMSNIQAKALNLNEEE